MHGPVLKPASRSDQLLMVFAAVICAFGVYARFVAHDAGRHAVGFLALGAMLVLQSVGALMVSIRWRRTLFWASFAIGLAWLVYFLVR